MGTTRTETKMQADRFYIQLRDGGGSLESARETLLDERVAIGVLLYVAHTLAPHDFGGSMVRSSLLTLIDEWEGAYAARQALQRVAPVLSHARAVIDLYKDRPEIEEQHSASPQSKADSASARIAELERALAARPVVEPEAALKLREAWAKASDLERSNIADPSWLNVYTRKIAESLRAFCESAPPASIPVREVVVESEAARKLREALASLPADDRVLLENPIKRTFESDAGFMLRCALHAFCESQPPTSAPSERVRLLTEQLNAQAKSHAEEAERWSREMGEAKRDAEHWKSMAFQHGSALTLCQRELEALKAAPARVERDVDRELREAWPGWDNRPDEDITRYSPGTQRLILAGRAWLAAPLSAAPAPSEERVTLYVRQFASGEIGIMCSQSEREREPALIDGDRWLAIEATVVREGGGEKGGAS